MPVLVAARALAVPVSRLRGVWVPPVGLALVVAGVIGAGYLETSAHDGIVGPAPTGAAAWQAASVLVLGVVAIVVVAGTATIRDLRAPTPAEPETPAAPQGGPRRTPASRSGTWSRSCSRPAARPPVQGAGRGGRGGARQAARVRGHPPQRQADRAAAFASGPAEREAVPVTVLGDLNAAVDSPQVRAFTARGLVDGLARVRPVRTYPADRPRREIDQVLVDPRPRVLAVEAPPSKASDHLPVAVTLGY